LISAAKEERERGQGLFPPHAAARGGEEQGLPGYSHGMDKKPEAKKKLKRKRRTAAKMPLPVLPVSAVIGASKTMQIVWPMALKSINLRRPTRSINGIGTRAEMKYATPLNPLSKRERSRLMPTEVSKIVGA
jgi:hypothetical protein